MGQNASGERAEEWGPTSAQLEEELRLQGEDAKKLQNTDSITAASSGASEAGAIRLHPKPGLPPMVHPAMPPASSHSHATAAYFQRVLARAESGSSSTPQPHDAAFLRHHLDIITQTARRREEEQKKTANLHLKKLAQAQLAQSQMLQKTLNELYPESKQRATTRSSRAKKSAVAVSVIPSTPVTSALVLQEQPAGSKPRTKKGRITPNVAVARAVHLAQVAPGQAPLAQDDVTQAVAVDHDATAPHTVNDQPTPGTITSPTVHDHDTNVGTLPATYESQPVDASSLHLTTDEFNEWMAHPPATDSAAHPLGLDVSHAFTNHLNSIISPTSLLASTTAPGDMDAYLYRDYDPFPAAAPETMPFDAFPFDNDEEQEQAIQSHTAVPSYMLNTISSDPSPVEDDESQPKVDSPLPMSTPGASISSDSSADSRTITSDRISKIYSNCLSVDILSKLESEYASGNFSAAAVRQYLMWATSALDADDQSELLDNFTKLDLRGCEDALHSCRHVDVHPSAGVPCCPARAPPEWGGRILMEARRWSGGGDATQEATSTQPHVAGGATTAANDLESTPVPSQFDQDLTPLEAAEDDPDGVARMRVTMLFSAPAKLKRRMGDGDADPVASGDDAADAASDPTVHVHRMTQLNKAYERFHGFSQQDVYNYAKKGTFDLSRMNSQLRSDYVASVQRIQSLWRLHGITEGHMYQVRLVRGGEQYCLVHLQTHMSRGLFLSMVESIIPLDGKDPLHPMPPFVEGVDIDIDTVLYGYRPPIAPLTDEVQEFQP